MSRSRITLAAALLLPSPSDSTRFTIRAHEPAAAPPADILRPVYHAKPHEPPAHILNRKKRRKA